ncbi:H-NS family nucleoid-associated regulatory protein [Paraburkholderia sp. RL17-383-BIF-A]|jgi:DNA-binding protein H-NS|uniref:H-NS histone family protein n=1 Tax=Burkholderiaceae TaxID=119060 RepID=UPI000897CE74|nr:H-NS family nucleoid-associated regulatory protein [Burkholderia sp. WP9]SEF05181.1 DNA-binding protein H-NS [Burkholderia sp. WP9]
MDERKRDSMIAYLRHRMEEFGIKPEDLAAVLASEPAAKKGERYRSATGDSWDGQGEMPQWLKQAISAGQSIDHFELSAAPAPAPAPQPKKRVDWQNDPFAGSPLARSNNR